MGSHLSMRKIGFYGGTFDPIHFGHLNLAIELMEAHGLHQVWFCPAFLSPHKQDDHPIEAFHRVRMVQLAIEDIPQFRLIETEVKRQGPSYTVDTLKELIEANPETQFHLLLGDDAIPGFFRWHRPEEIIRLVPLLIGQRMKLNGLSGDPAICQAIQKGLTPTPIIEISATAVRERLKKKMYCGHLLPAKVLDYICQNRLY